MEWSRGARHAAAMQELLPEQLQTPPRVVSARTPAVSRVKPLGLGQTALEQDEEEALTRVSDLPAADLEVRRLQ